MKTWREGNRDATAARAEKALRRRAFPKALELVERMREQGLTLVIATTAEPEELQGVFPLLGPHAPTLFADAATAKEAGQSKPDGDVVHVAVERSGYRPEELMMIGDTPYDSEAAAKVGSRRLRFAVVDGAMKI